MLIDITLMGHLYARTIGMRHIMEYDGNDAFTVQFANGELYLLLINYN